MDEMWKAVDGFDGFYEISNMGRIRSLDRICGKMPSGADRNWTGKMMTPVDNGRGYLIIHLKRDGKRYIRYIHRLVAEAFLEKPAGCNVVNHIDYNTRNNSCTNLEWCTQKANVQHSRQRMCVPRNHMTNTGEKYIHHNEKYDSYSVWIRQVKAYKSFKTLEEAVAFRNEVLNEFSISK